ncbi:VOC family protein [Lujinxingia vulgaris]|uniref:VOC family protein n=1 Tax=Lujinxingia vulgaris TaxID=2600176 RepID=A0A5C6X414_9DELT|nr:VOC family protein [Lujinxingia vulgaris]TXD35857.1 VOC family protein [Lujinxingia vulgaris]
MKIVTYLNFDGTCREAFEFYAGVLGGKLTMQVVSESPAAEHMAPEFQDSVMHACLEVGDQTLMASDTMHMGYTRPQGFSVSLQFETPEEAERVFEALAEGGEVRMPLERTFWALRFGTLEDRFGTPWMINCNERECT